MAQNPSQPRDLDGSQQGAAEEHGTNMNRAAAHGAGAAKALPWGWRLALYASAALSVAQIIGNIALYIVRPTRHWPVLESVETLELLSLVPTALLLQRLNRASPLSLLLTVVGMLAIAASAAISIGFVTELTGFGKGVMGGPVYYISSLTVFLWLIGANVVAWRSGRLPGIMVPLTIVYPVWAILLARRAGRAA